MLQTGSRAWLSTFPEDTFFEFWMNNNFNLWILIWIMVFRWKSFMLSRCSLFKYSPPWRMVSLLKYQPRVAPHTVINWCHGFWVKTQIQGLNISLFAASDWLIPRVVESVWQKVEDDKLFLCAYLQVMLLRLFWFLRCARADGTLSGRS